jgi:carbamoyl-phosphate synthase / aspartate carbamoyltransferase / dihydroorotase
LSLRLPGLIDPHVHLREPGAIHKEDFESGTKAALAGGFTMVLAMPNTQPPLIDSASLEVAEQAAAKKAVSDYGIFLGASTSNVETAAALAHRVAGLKIYLDTTYGPLHLADLGALREHFARWPVDRPILCHAEERMLAAVLMLAWLEKRRVHICHVSRKTEIELIRDAKMCGIDVTCEVGPHHLFLSQDDAARLGQGRSQVRPPLATRADQDALWENMEFIDCIATDHAPHTLAEKDSDNPPPGFPGLETSLALMLKAVHEERIGLDEVVTRMYDNPRRLFGLPEQLDTWIEVDPDGVWTVRNEEIVSRCGWTPFAGWRLRGRVQHVVMHGRTVYHHGTFSVEPGTGRNLAPAYRRLESLR